MSFRQHTESLGIELLRDDIRFIKSQLLRIPEQLRRGVLEEYCEVWITASRLCDNPIKRDNIGRRAANIWLREHHHESENRAHRKS